VSEQASSSALYATQKLSPVPNNGLSGMCSVVARGCGFLEALVDHGVCHSTMDTIPSGDGGFISTLDEW
jgi:hypothetical protein